MPGASPPPAGAEVPSARPRPVPRVGTTRQRIWAAILELAAQDKHFTRQRLKKLTGLPFTQIDDHCDGFLADGLIERIGAGVFEMVKQWRPPVAISVTVLDDGSVVLERGDAVLDFTPSEMRTLARLVAGWAQEQAHLDRHELLLSTLAAVDMRTRKLLLVQNAPQRPKPSEPRPRPSLRRPAATA